MHPGNKMVAGAPWIHFKRATTSEDRVVNPVMTGQPKTVKMCPRSSVCALWMEKLNVLPVLIEWICDEFGVKRDVRQAVAVLDPAHHP